MGSAPPSGIDRDRPAEPALFGAPYNLGAMISSRQGTAMPPTGQRDYSTVRLTRHALDRFVERFGTAPAEAEESLRAALLRTRRLGRNPDNGAIAVLAVYRARALVAVLQGG